MSGMIKRFIKTLIKSFLYFFYRIYYGNKIIIFESHYICDGNSGALYKYLRKNKKYKNYTCLWISGTYDDKSLKNRRHDLFFSINKESLIKNYLMKMASFSFFDDIPVRPRKKNSKTIYLTHGVGGLKDVKGLIVMPDYLDYALCTSESYKSYYCDRIGCPLEKVFICGLPRNDALFKEAGEKPSFLIKHSYSKMVLWLPTFRKATGVDRNDSSIDYPFGIPFFKSLETFKTINDYLVQSSILLTIKLHPIQDLSVINDPHFSNIIFLSHADCLAENLSTNSLFLFSDALITDYSAAHADYMLLDRPLAYIPEGDTYKLRSSQEYYEKFTPGNKIYNLDDFIKFLQDVAEGKDVFRDKREEVTNYIHHYKDGNNCKRIVEMFNL